MPDDGPKRPRKDRSKFNWIAVRTACVVKGWTLQRCAEEFGIDPTTVRKRASKEGWISERHSATTDATAHATSEALEVVANAGAELQAKHAQVILGLHTLLDGCTEDIQASKPGRGRAETRRACLQSFEIAAKLGRLALGLTDGQSSVTDAEDDGKQRVIFVGPSDEKETA